MRDEMTIRRLTSEDDFRACIDLQRETWGQDFNDTVPPSILLVSQKLGGVAAGAFAPDGRMIGFVFGMTGVENGSIVHWSDMLAVRTEVQNLGVGRRLKEFQRHEAARVGARVIYWTFDPLVARNAHLNFNVFGVRAVEYVRDMYGLSTGSDLHRDIGTDRLIVAWPVADAELEAQRRAVNEARESAAFQSAPIVGDVDHTDHRLDGVIGSQQRVRIAVPLDVSVVQARDAAHAARWRSTTRAAFEKALGAGYKVAGFSTVPDQERGFYLLASEK